MQSKHEVNRGLTRPLHTGVGPTNTIQYSCLNTKSSTSSVGILLVRFFENSHSSSVYCTFCVYISHLSLCQATKVCSSQIKLTLVLLCTFDLYIVEILLSEFDSKAILHIRLYSNSNTQYTTVWGPLGRYTPSTEITVKTWTSRCPSGLCPTSEDSSCSKYIQVCNGTFL